MLVIVTISAALAHATLIYAFHFLDPTTRQRIELEQRVSAATERGYDNAHQQLERMSDQLTEQLVESVLYQARQQIGAQTAHHLRQGDRMTAVTGSHPVVDLPARDAAPRTLGAPPAVAISGNGNGHKEGAAGDSPLAGRR
jgi:DNA integrity scanning protein DisA with diadenylate cyclase activity